ncbi:hypothetical protein [Enterovibrio norvegicus]|uniref:hypothetical protein n=1 Tax=Enterovibrio norvegicus TaxID=188144 RepID=UPI000C84F3BC|nr:hypothetical protein [Enterovibrio norvegicus]PMN64429.1 hypothetical protein BCT27_10750 [Enterovibrio norvegicus]
MKDFQNLYSAINPRYLQTTPSFIHSPFNEDAEIVFFNEESAIIYKSEESFWIDSLFVMTPLGEVSNGSSLSIELFNGDTKSTIGYSRKTNERGMDKFHFTIEGLFKQISLKSNDFSKSVCVKGASVLGWSVNNLISIGSEIRDAREGYKKELQDITNEVSDKNLEITVLSEQIELKKDEVASLDTSIANKSEFRKQIDEEISLSIGKNGDLNTEFELLEDKIKVLSLNLEKKKNEKIKLSSELSSVKNSILTLEATTIEKKEKLAKYESKLRFFSEDYEGLKAEVFSQNGTLSFGVFFLLIVSCIVATNMFTSATMVINEFTAYQSVNVFNLFLSRLPLLSINLMVLGFAIKVITKLIDEILLNNKTITDIKKIEFLVSQTVTSEALNDEERRKKNIEQKIDVIKSYLNFKNENT